MLDLINVRKTFNKGTINQRVALDGINLHLEDGDFVTVIGGNGAGKSTMLNAVAGVWPVDDGRIILDGEDITALPDYKRAKNGNFQSFFFGVFIHLLQSIGGFFAKKVRFIL